MKKFYAVAFFVFSMGLTSLANNYFTPGTGVKWTLTQLVANSGGDVTFSGGQYFVNDTVFISLNDTLQITSDAVVKFIVGSYLDVNGVLLINPPTGVTFTAQGTSSGFLGMRLDSTNGTVLRKLTFEYAVSMRIADCSPTLDSCILQYNNNNTSTSFGNGAIALFRANPVIKNSKFLFNQRAAIQGGSNINNAPKVYNCFFQGNNTVNATSLPQINLGATSTAGSDTVKILNSQFIGGATLSGAIGFLPIGNVYAIVSGNLMRKNRYGLTFNGSTNINAIVSYNVIDSNNIQNDPNAGGSGISFTGGSATAIGQNTIVTGNILRANLWGITIQGRSKPNLGDLTNTDTTDDGKNQFINNTNTTTPGIDLYNNSSDPIMAQNNYWNTTNLATVEAQIFHQPDNSALGLVNYTPLFTVVPVKLKQFVITPDGKNVLLSWQTATEENSHFFSIEKSKDGRTFVSIGSIDAKGNPSSYSFTDFNVLMDESTIYYRLKMVDKDGKFIYSPVLSIKKNGDTKSGYVKLYPTIASPSQTFNAEIASDKPQRFTVQFINASGQLLNKVAGNLEKGKNLLSIKSTQPLPTGKIYLVFNGESFVQTVPVIVN